MHAHRKALTHECIHARLLAPGSQSCTHTGTHSHRHTHTHACMRAYAQAPTRVCTTKHSTCATAPRQRCHDEEDADAEGGGGGCGAAAQPDGAALLLLLLAAATVPGSVTGNGMRTRRVSHWEPRWATSSTCSDMSNGKTSLKSASACTPRPSDTMQHPQRPNICIVSRKQSKQHGMHSEGGGLIPNTCAGKAVGSFPAMTCRITCFIAKTCPDHAT